MSINTALDFFVEKRAWSKVKDALLGWYLTPYISKILMASENFYLIDCFAGPGLFEDGEKGSPLIEAELLSSCYQRTNNSNVKIHLICIEKDKKIYERLVNNTKAIGFVECFNGTADSILPSIFETINNNSAVFLYLDPFGIKDLPIKLESLFSKRKDLKIEMLLNFNSAGCYRECKRLLGDKEFDSYFADNQYLLDNKSTLTRMSKLLGTDDWKNIVERSNHEYLLSTAICSKYKTYFKYALNMPIRNGKNDVLKYRMLHFTNSTSGALLMADNMLLQNSRSKLSLFSTDLEGRIINIEEMIPKVIDYIPDFTDKPIRLNELLVKFYENVGVVCMSKDLKSFLKTKENEGLLIVNRIPSCTEKGASTHFWSEDNGHVVKITKKFKV